MMGWKEHKAMVDSNRMHKGYSEKKEPMREEKAESKMPMKKRMMKEKSEMKGWKNG